MRSRLFAFGLVFISLLFTSSAFASAPDASTMAPPAVKQALGLDHRHAAGKTSVTIVRAAGAKAEMSSPVAGSTLSGASQEFSWTAGQGDGVYWITVGRTQGGMEIYNDVQWKTSGTVDGLPCDGSTLHLRLFTHFASGWQYTDYTYTAAGSAPGKVPAEMSSPENGTTLEGASQDFEWSAGGGEKMYWISIGREPGGMEIFNEVQWENTASIEGLPTDGSTLYLRLFTHFADGWQYRDYVYTAYNSGGGGTKTKAVMETPVGGSRLTSSTQEFAWTAGTGAQEYWLSISKSYGGNDIYDGTQWKNLSATVDNLPTDGSTLYVRLGTRFSTGWEFNEYSYIAAYETEKAQMLFPLAGSELSGTSHEFHWTKGENNEGVYWITAGSDIGGAEYFVEETTDQFCMVSGLPTTGTLVYVRLYTKFSTGWEYVDYEYIAAGTPPGDKAEMTSPVPGSRFPSYGVAFTWTNIPAAMGYLLEAGSAKGASDYAYQEITGPDDTYCYVDDMPQDNATVYVRLWTMLPDGAVFNDYTYTTAENNDLWARMITPKSSALLSSFSQSFRWTPVAGADEYQLKLIHMGTGDEFYNATFDHDETVCTVGVIPSDGGNVQAQLITRREDDSTNSWYYYYRTAGGILGPDIAEISSPENETKLAGGTQTFRIFSNHVYERIYHVSVGSAPGQSDYYSSMLDWNATSFTATGLPVDGSKIHVTIWTKLSIWGFQSNAYTYTAAGSPSDHAAEIYEPDPSLPLGWDEQTFKWVRSSDAQSYSLYVGSQPGMGDYFAQNVGNATSARVSGLPVGSDKKVYVRLWTQLHSGWVKNDYAYTGAPTGPIMTTPAPGSLLYATTTFGWEPIQGVDKYYLSLYFSNGLNPPIEVLKTTVSGTSCTVEIDKYLKSNIYLEIRAQLNDGAWYKEEQRYQLTNPVSMVTAPGSGSIAPLGVVEWSEISGKTYRVTAGTEKGGTDLVDNNMGTVRTLAYDFSHLEDDQEVWFRVYTMDGDKALGIDDLDCWIRSEN